MLTTPVQLITDGDMSGDLSAIQQLKQMFGYSIQAVYTGSPVGTLSLAASNDYNPNTGVGTWTAIADSSEAITAAGDGTWNYRGPNYEWVKVIYDATSGTGVLNVYFNGKGF